MFDLLSLFDRRPDLSASFSRPIDSRVLDRVVYLSGPHGSGKSTLIADIKDSAANVTVVEQIAHLESLTDMIERSVWRIALHAIEHRQNLHYAEDHPDIYVLGDRCYLDDEVYWTAFEHLGWLTRSQRRSILQLQRVTYRLTSTPLPKRVIVMCPPLDWNRDRVLQRHDAGERIKWNENDFTYLAYVNAAFHKTAPNNNRLILRETDREKRAQLVKDWVTRTPPPVSPNIYSATEWRKRADLSAEESYGWSDHVKPATERVSQGGQSFHTGRSFVESHRDVMPYVPGRGSD